MSDKSGRYKYDPETGRMVKIGEARGNHRGRLVEFFDRDEEYRETGEQDAAVKRDQAMRDTTMKDFEHANEYLHDKRTSDKRRRYGLMEKYGFDSARWRKEEKNDG